MVFDLYLLHAFLLAHLVPAFRQIWQPHPREDKLHDKGSTCKFCDDEKRDRIGSDRNRIRSSSRPGGLVVYLEGLVHVLGPLLGPLGQLGALHRKEVVLLLLSRQRDVDPRQLEPLHAQLLGCSGGGAVAGQRRVVVVVVVIVLGFHVQDGVHGGRGLVPLVRRRPLLRRSLLDGPRKKEE